MRLRNTRPHGAEGAYWRAEFAHHTMERGAHGKLLLPSEQEGAMALKNGLPFMRRPGIDRKTFGCHRRSVNPWILPGCQEIGHGGPEAHGCLRWAIGEATLDQTLVAAARGDAVLLMLRAGSRLTAGMILRRHRCRLRHAQAARSADEHGESNSEEACDHGSSDDGGRNQFNQDLVCVQFQAKIRQEATLRALNWSLSRLSAQCGRSPNAVSIFLRRPRAR